MNKKTIITALLALVAVEGSSKIYKTLFEQLCLYRDFSNIINYWQVQTPETTEERYNMYMSHITHPYIRKKTQQLYLSMTKK